MLLSIMGEPHSAWMETEAGWRRLVRGAGEAWSGGGIELTLATQAQGGRMPIRLQAAADAEPVRTVKLRWRLPLGGGLRLLGDHWERAYGDLEWRGLVPERVMPWYFLATDGSRCWGVGVATGGAAMCSWQADASGVTLTLDVRCGNAGTMLGGRLLKAAEVIVSESAEGQSPYAFARTFCAAMCERPKLPDHPVYGGNNWYYAYGNSSHDDIVNDARFIASLAPAGGNRPYMVIDDGWQERSGGGACNGGPWVGNGRFPDMAGLAGEMKASGVRPGIWYRPLLTQAEVPQSWVRYTASGGYVLDPSVPGVLDDIAQTAGTLADWGYELIKHDFTTFDMLGLWGFEMKGDVHGLPHAFADRTKTTAEIMSGLYRTIAEASKDAVIIGCNTVGHLAAGLFEIQRTGDDTSGRTWERTRRMGINTLAFRMAQHGTMFSHDADCVGLTPHVPWELNREWLRLLAGSGTPLFVSAAPGSLTPELEQAVRDAFARAARQQLPAEPLDWLGNTCPQQWLLDGEPASFDWHDGRADADAARDNEWWR